MGVEAEVTARSADSRHREGLRLLRPAGTLLFTITYTWPDFYNGAQSKWSKFLAFSSTLGVVLLVHFSGDWLSKRPDPDFAKRGDALAAGAVVWRSTSRLDTARCSRHPGAYRQKTAQNLNVDMSALAPYTEDFIMRSAKAVKEDYPNIPVNIFLSETSRGCRCRTPSSRTTPACTSASSRSSGETR